MMNERDLELLSAYLDNTLTAEARSAVDARLLTDAPLRRELDTLRETKLLISGLPQLKAPRDFTLTAAMVGGRARTLPVILSPWVSALSAAAAVIMTVLGVITLNVRPSALTSVASAPTGTMTLQPQIAAPGAMATESFEVFTPTLAVQGTLDLPFAGDAPPVTFTPSPDPAAAMIFGAAETTVSVPASETQAVGGAGAAAPVAPMATMGMATAVMESAPAASAEDASVAMMPPPTLTEDAARAGSAMDALEASTPMPAMTTQAEAMQIAAPTMTVAAAADVLATATALPTQPPTATSTNAANEDGIDAMNGVGTSVPEQSAIASSTPSPASSTESLPNEGFGGATLFLLAGILFGFALLTTLLRGRR
ncbi:MAG: hypothetical protein SF123_12940 [Chloroflexota bacterium]|nr:hypothetical protein [Chloroflexota bacterium]